MALHSELRGDHMTCNVYHVVVQLCNHLASLHNAYYAVMRMPYSLINCTGELGEGSSSC